MKTDFEKDDGSFSESEMKQNEYNTHNFSFFCFDKSTNWYEQFHGWRTKKRIISEQQTI